MDPSRFWHVVTLRCVRLPRNVSTVSLVSVSTLGISLPCSDVKTLCSVLRTMITRDSAPPVSGWPWAEVVNRVRSMEAGPSGSRGVVETLAMAVLGGVLLVLEQVDEGVAAVGTAVPLRLGVVVRTAPRAWPWPGLGVRLATRPAVAPGEAFWPPPPALVRGALPTAAVPPGGVGPLPMLVLIGLSTVVAAMVPSVARGCFGLAVPALGGRPATPPTTAARPTTTGTGPGDAGGGGTAWMAVATLEPLDDDASSSASPASPGRGAGGEAGAAEGGGGAATTLLS